MKISKNQLLEKLHQIDERLVNIWLTEDPKISDDDIWEIFVVLLETRVELLKSCREAGVLLAKDTATPSWLDRLFVRKKEIRLRELRSVSRALSTKGKIKAYEVGGDS